ncbi:MAG: hypothetical protein U0Q19_07735 [Kineosporiaceae bacterium]
MPAAVTSVAARLARRLPAPARRLAARARRVVRRVLGRPVAAQPVSRPAPPPPVDLPPRPQPPQTPVRLLIGPANFAGQGWEWGRAVERELHGVGVQVFMFTRPDGFNYPCDYGVPAPVYRSTAWGIQQEEYVPQHFTHVLIEAGRPVLGFAHGGEVAAEAGRLRRAGLAVAMLAHGSDVRLPSRHAELYPHSPFTDTEWDLVAKLEAQAERLGAIINEDTGLAFVSTPDLLDDVPRATWLPVVLDLQRWACATVPLERDRPLVVHAPSNTRIKGTELIEPIVERLAEKGLIDYRRITGVANADMPALFAQADVVLDQFVLGSYGVAACEGLAAGRVVIGHVADRVRERIGEELPIVEATADTLEDVLDRVCAERDWARAQATAGVEYVRRVHDGRRSAQVLSTFLS